MSAIPATASHNHATDARLAQLAERVASLESAVTLAAELIERVRNGAILCDACKGCGRDGPWAWCMPCPVCRGRGTRAVAPTAAELELAVRQLHAIGRGEK